MSAVRKLEYEQPEPLRKRKPAKPRRGKKIKPTIDDLTILYNTSRYKIPKRVIFTVLLIFAGGIGTAATFAYMQDMRQQITRTRAAISYQRAYNDAAEAMMVQRLSVDEITRIAQERLNMGPPDASQIIHINVPPQSYVIQSDAPARRQPDGMWQSALWYIRNWLGV